MDAWDGELVLVRLSWGARGESADRVARRLRETLALLRGLVPGQPDRLAYPDDLADAGRWSAYVAEHVVRADDGRAEPESGFAPSVTVDAADGSTAVSVQVSAGGVIETGSTPSNSVLVRFGTSTGPSPALPAGRNLAPVAVDLVRGLVSIWQPDLAVLTSRAGNKAQLRLGPRRGVTIGAVSWLSGRTFPAPGEVAGAVTTAYGDGTLLVVGSPDAPSIDSEAALAVRAQLPEPLLQTAAPAVQEAPPDVPAVDVLPADQGGGGDGPATEAPADPEAVLARLRETTVPLPATLAGLAEQPGWPEVIADVRGSFDRLVSEPPFLNRLDELDRGQQRVREDLVLELLREVSLGFADATAGRYLELYRGLLALESAEEPGGPDSVGAYASTAESDLREVRDRVDSAVGTLVQHEVAGRTGPRG